MNEIDNTKILADSKIPAGNEITTEILVNTKISAKEQKTMLVFKDLAKNYIDDLGQKLDGEKRYTPSNLSVLDENLGGFLHDGHLIIIGARPSMGKTSVAQQIAENVSEQNGSVLFFSLEMSSHEVVERSVVRRSGINLQKLRTAHFDDADWQLLGASINQIAPLPFFVDDSTFDIVSITHKARSAATGFEARGYPPLKLIVIDYLQLITSKLGGGNRTLEVSAISRALKLLAKELKIPVIALSQLNRKLEERPEKRPIMSDLRDSGSIEQDADLVLFLYRDEIYNPDGPDKGIMEIIAGKNRHGSRETSRMTWSGERMCLYDINSYAISDYEDKQSHSNNTKKIQASANTKKRVHNNAW